MRVINGVDVYAISVPTRRVLANSQKSFRAYHFVVAAVRTDDAVGWGWTYTQGVAGGVIGRIARSILGPVVMGRTAMERGIIWRDWLARSYSVGMTGVFRLAAAALDIALWDLWGKETGASLTQLLGGPVRSKAPAYYSHLDIAADEDRHLEEAAMARQQGFRLWKTKVGRSQVSADVTIIQKLKDAGWEVLVDANQKFTAEEAVCRALAYRDAGAWLMEEPVQATDFSGYERVAQIEGLLVAGGESLYQPEWLPLLHQAGVDVLQPDLFRVGGITPLMQWLGWAEALKIPVMLHCSEELATSLALASTVITHVEHLPAISLRELGLSDDGVRVIDGHLVPPNAHGHGITFDLSRLAGFPLLTD